MPGGYGINCVGIASSEAAITETAALDTAGRSVVRVVDWVRHCDSIALATDARVLRFMIGCLAGLLAVLRPPIMLGVVQELFGAVAMLVVYMRRSFLIFPSEAPQIAPQVRQAG